MKKTFVIASLLILFGRTAFAQDNACNVFERVTNAARSGFADVRGAAKGPDRWAVTASFPGFEQCELTRADKIGTSYSCKKTGFASLDAAKDGIRSVTKVVLPCLDADPLVSVNDMKTMLIMMLMRTSDQRSINLSTLESSRLDTEALKVVKEWVVTLTVFQDRDR